MKVKVIDKESLFYGFIIDVEKRGDRYFFPDDCEYFCESQIEIISQSN